MDARVIWRSPAHLGCFPVIVVESLEHGRSHHPWHSRYVRQERASTLFLFPRDEVPSHRLSLIDGHAVPSCAGDLAPHLVGQTKMKNGCPLPYGFD